MPRILIDLFFFFAIAAAAKLLQSCPTLCDPVDGNPPGSPVPGILQARTLEWVANIWNYISTCASVGFPHGSTGKESACSVGDLGLISELGRSPREGNDYPLQYSGLENFMDCVVHGVAKSQNTTERLSHTYSSVSS